MLLPSSPDYYERMNQLTELDDFEDYIKNLTPETRIDLIEMVEINPDIHLQFIFRHDKRIILYYEVALVLQSLLQEGYDFAMIRQWMINYFKEWNCTDSYDPYNYNELLAIKAASNNIISVFNPKVKILIGMKKLVSLTSGVSLLETLTIKEYLNCLFVYCWFIISSYFIMIGKYDNNIVYIEALETARSKSSNQWGSILG